MKSKSSLTKNFLIYGAGNMLYALIVLLLIPMYLEKLNIEDYGKFSIFYVSGNLISIIFSFSISNGILRYFSEFNSNHLRQSAVSSTILFFALFFALLLLVLYVLNISGFKIIFLSEVDKKSLLYIFIWGFSRVVLGLLLGVLRALEKPIKYVTLTILDVTLLCCFNFYVIFFTDFGIDNILTSYLISALISVIVGLIFLKSFFIIKFNYKSLKYLIAYGLPLSIANALSYLISYGNRYFLVYYSNTRDVAIFDVAQKITSVISIVLVNAFMISFTPFYLKSYNDLSLEDFKEEVNAKIRIFLTAYFLLAILIIFSDDVVLNLLSKKEYLNATSFTPMLIVSNALNVLFMLLTLSTNINKKTKIEMYIVVITIAIGFLLNITLVPILGLMGASISQIIMSLTSFLLINYYNKLYFPLDYKYSTLVILLLLFFLITVFDFLLNHFQIKLSIKFLIYFFLIAVYIYLYRRQFNFFTALIKRKF